MNDFIAVLSKRLADNLPGNKAHEPLRAVPTGKVIPKFEHVSPPRAGSVLILLYEQEGEHYFPLIKRTDYKGLHSGQISLPGGKKEKGETEEQTALRETFEEIGVDPLAVKIIGQLSNFFVIPSNFMVTPFVASIDYKPAFIPDPREVDKIIQANLHNLIDDDAITTAEILAAGQFKLNAPHFKVEDEIVWGATAMMLNELRMVVREILK